MRPWITKPRAKLEDGSGVRRDGRVVAAFFDFAGDDGRAAKPVSLLRVSESWITLSASSLSQKHVNAVPRERPVS